MKIKSILASLSSNREKKMGKDEKSLVVESEADQTFIVVAYRDQELYIYLVSDSNKNFTILNFLELKIPSLVVGEDQVLRVSELADTISDAIEVFSMKII